MTEREQTPQKYNTHNIVEEVLKVGNTITRFVLLLPEEADAIVQASRLDASCASDPQQYVRLLDAQAAYVSREAERVREALGPMVSKIVVHEASGSQPTIEVIMRPEFGQQTLSS